MITQSKLLLNLSLLDISCLRRINKPDLSLQNGILRLEDRLGTLAITATSQNYRE